MDSQRMFWFQMKLDTFQLLAQHINVTRCSSSSSSSCCSSCSSSIHQWVNMTCSQHSLTIKQTTSQVTSLRPVNEHLHQPHSSRCIMQTHGHSSPPFLFIPIFPSTTCCHAVHPCHKMAAKSHQRASDSLKNSTHYMYLYTLSVCLDDTHHWYTASNCCDVSWEIWQTQRRHDIHITHCSYHSPHFISSEISLLWLAAATPNWVVCCESTQFATNHSTQLKWRKVATSGDEVQ